jgi:ABC-2 type transport system permease protein
MMFGQVLATEFLKLRRSKITWLSWLAFSVMPLAGGLFMWIIQEPQRAAQLGLLGQKARFAGATANWLSYSNILLQAAGVGGMILVSVIAAFVFGREYSDSTGKNMLGLPIARYRFVLAKLAVVFTWFGILTVLFIIEGLAVGTLLGLSGFSASLAASSAGDILLAALVAYLLVPFVAWIATLGQGYLAPLGFTIFMLVLGMVLGATGWGKWFPWSIVPLFAGVAGPRVEALAPASLVIVLCAFAAGIMATIAQVRYADNNQ